MVDFPTALHRTLLPLALEGEGLGVLHHVEDAILDDGFGEGEVTLAHLYLR